MATSHASILSALAFLVGCGSSAPPEPPAAEAPPVAEEAPPTPTEEPEPPPMEVELCVDATPAGAKVVVNEVEAAERCTTVVGAEGEQIVVEVSAPGHETHKAELIMDDALEPLTVTLVPTPGAAPTPPGDGH